MPSSEAAFAFFCFCCGISLGVLLTAFGIFLYSTSSRAHQAVEATNAECDASAALDPIRMTVARGDTRSQLTEDAQARMRKWIMGRIAFKATHSWAVNTDPFKGIELRFKTTKRGD